MDISFLIEIAVVIIVIAVVFAVVSMFVPIDQRIRNIMWLVIAAVVAIVLLEWLGGFIGGGHHLLR